MQDLFQHDYPKAIASCVTYIHTEVKEFSKDLSPDELAQWLLLKHVPKGDCDKIKGTYHNSTVTLFSSSAS